MIASFIRSSRFRAGLAALLLTGGGTLPGAEATVLSNRLDATAALTLALEHNLAIRAARERLREQEGVITEVKSLALPQAGLVGGYSRNDEDLTSDRGISSSTQNWALGLQVRQTLYQGGGVQAALAAQRSTREAALMDLQATLDRELLNVRTRFYDALLAREQVAVQESNVALLAEQLATTRHRFEAGAVSQFEVLRAEVELANARPALIRARNDQRNALVELRRVIGLAAPRDEVELVGELAFAPVHYELGRSLAEARARRPELRQLAALVEAREAGVRYARSGYRPEVAVVGGYELRKNNFSDRFSDSVDGWSLGVQSSWALFDGRATAGRVAQARSRLEQTRLQAEELELLIEVEVRRALSALQEAAELAEAAGITVTQAEEAMRLAEARYAAGTATQLDLLQVRVALTLARDNQLQANYRHHIALAQLRRATGAGEVVLAD
jgi:outer membrane protein